MNQESFHTKDGITIAADYYPSTIQNGMLLLHMMPSNRFSWRPFAVKLQENGFHVLAIDLRGHGESTGGPDGYRTFSDSEHQKSIFDVEAAVDFLRSKGVEKIHLGGASIGANLALQYASQHIEIPSVMLLSPGLDYHGIHADIWMDNLKSHQAVLLAASDDDMYSFTSVKTLFEHAANLFTREVKLLSEAGHGTDMFQKNSQFIDELIVWIKRLPS